MCDKEVIFKRDFPLAAAAYAPGCVYGSVANNGLAKGIVCINILGIKHSGKTEVSITPDTVLSGEITILALGEYKALQKCFRI